MYITMVTSSKTMPMSLLEQATEQYCQTFAPKYTSKYMYFSIIVLRPVDPIDWNKNIKNKNTCFKSQKNTVEGKTTTRSIYFLKEVIAKLYPSVYGTITHVTCQLARFEVKYRDPPSTGKFYWLTTFWFIFYELFVACNVLGKK